MRKDLDRYPYLQKYLPSWRQYSLNYTRYMLLKALWLIYWQKFGDIGSVWTTTDRRRIIFASRIRYTGRNSGTVVGVPVITGFKTDHLMEKNICFFRQGEKRRLSNTECHARCQMEWHGAGNPHIRAGIRIARMRYMPHFVPVRLHDRTAYINLHKAEIYNLAELVRYEGKLADVETGKLKALFARVSQVKMFINIAYSL